MTNPLPPRPRLVLRVGFAGSQRLDGSSGAGTALGLVFETIAGALSSVAHGIAPRSRVYRFYSEEKPLLRLITGLCQGGDDLAARTLEAMRDDPSFGTSVTAEQAAVIPFDLPAYRASRPAGFLAEFDRQAARCAYILCLDGIYDKPDPDTPLAKNRRATAARSAERTTVHPR